MQQPIKGTISAEYQQNLLGENVETEQNKTAKKNHTILTKATN